VTGLRRRERDPELPGRCGQPELRPLDVGEVEQLIREELLREGAPAVAEVTWEYARWKPALSLTSAYSVRFEDGEERIVSLKTFTDGKPRDLAERVRVDPVIDERCDRLRPFHVDPERGHVLWTFPFDRVLRGQADFLDPRSLARMVEQSGIVAPRSVRRRRITWELLRYKPERRAVWKVTLGVRGSRAGERRLLGRILPAASARRAFTARWALGACEPACLVPRPIYTDTPHGIALEEWLDLTTFAPDSFEHAERAGAALGLLHQHPLAAEVPAVRVPELARLESLFAIDPRLARRFRQLRIPVPAGTQTWTHGDFHPDQVALERGTGCWRMLDLDLVGPGDPLRDLASWIADELLEGGAPAPVKAGAELLGGYRSAGCPPVDRTQLGAWVARQLIARAAAAIRRLERGALEKATAAMELATELVPKGARVR